MFEFFDKILGYLMLLVTFVMNLADMFLTFIGVLLNVVSLPTVLMFIVPGVIGSSLLVVIAFAVIKLILNR